MQSLCPLPPVRTEFEPDGYKYLNITHENSTFEIISDFSNKVSPHSFLVNGIEQNISGTTAIQEELITKNFGITPAIRNLIYNKVQLCDTTRSERKQLFLNINPMELGLILDTHKKCLGKIKDAKAMLNHLFNRKADIESKLIPSEVLEEHKKNKEKLSNQLIAIDKIIYGLEQHISNLRSTYKEQIEYGKIRRDKGLPIISKNELLEACKKINQKCLRFCKIDRSKKPESEYSRYNTEAYNFYQKSKEIEKYISDISKEINEYNKHMENSGNKQPASIEKEIKEIDIELAKYPPIPEKTIPTYHLDEYEFVLQNKIKVLLFYFRDLSVPMIPPKTIQLLEKKYQNIGYELKNLYREQADIDNALKNLNIELSTLSGKADVPSNCITTACGLRRIFEDRKKGITTRIDEITKRKIHIDKRINTLLKIQEILYNKISPYTSSSISAIQQYDNLLTALNNFFSIQNWNDNLLHLLRTQPMKIYKDLEEYIEISRIADIVSKLKEKRQKLSIELDALIKSNAVSIDFIKKKLVEKEEQIKIYLRELDNVEQQYTDTKAMAVLYADYMLIADEITQIQNSFDMGAETIMVERAIRYWTDLLNYFIEGKKFIGEDLRRMETLVREQDVLQLSYQKEVLEQIKIIQDNKRYYDRIESALSPTTGMPHKSMVKYLNALINNVNYFLDQIWTYRLRIRPLDINQSIDYLFKIEVDNNVQNDISQLSDGQKAAVNFSWILAILLQLKLLDKIPFFGDELGREFFATHRLKLLQFIERMVDNKIINQIFLVNNFTEMSDAFRDCDLVCLSPDQMNDISSETNKNVTMLVD